MTADLTFEQGEVVVNEIVQIVDDPNAKVWEVDLHTKYAEVVGSSDGVIFVGAGEYTIKLDESRRGIFTTFTLPDNVEGWTIVYDGIARYTLRVVAYRHIGRY